MKKVNNGNLNKKIIKMKYFLYCIVWLCSCMIFTGCSNETLLPEQEIKNFDDLYFIVHVDNRLGELTRGASGKKYWSIGDKIILAIDNDDNNRCVLEYVGNENWQVSKVDEQTNFFKEQGKLCAIHADVLDIDGDSITTKGDVVYTQNGSYIKHENVVVINLDMNQRPVARIAIVGMNSNFNLKGLEEYNQLQSLSSMNWTLVDEPEKKHYREVYGDTCVYYGLLKSDKNGETKIHIADNDGVSYERTYHKQLKAGDNIVILGPFTNEASLWSKHILVHSIYLEQTELNLTVGDNFIIDASIYNNNADNKKLIWESSDDNIVTVNDNGLVMAHTNGDAKIIVKSADGSAMATCNVHVKDIEDFILVKRGNSFGTGGDESFVRNDFNIQITNTYTKPIELIKSIGLGSNNSEVLMYLSEFTASFPKTELLPSESIYVDIHLLFSKSFTIHFPGEKPDQTWLKIEFNKKDNNKKYDLRYFLPWEYM